MVKKLIIWLEYLLAPTTNTNKLKVIWCRYKGHKTGVWWYNPNGLEPDMHCKCCGDDLG